MIETTLTKTQYNELATSTCTPLGGGASTCTYVYKVNTSTTTSTTSNEMATTTLQQQYLADTMQIIFFFVVISVIFGVIMFHLTQKVT